MSARGIEEVDGAEPRTDALDHVADAVAVAGERRRTRCPGPLDGRAQLVHTAARHGDHRHDLDAQALAQQPQVQAHAEAVGLVHHVERQHQRPAELGELQRERQHALEVLRVDDVHQHVRGTPSSTMRCVTRSSSVVGSSEYMPGVSSTSHARRPASCCRARPRPRCPGNWRRWRSSRSGG
jgi:hypothetical protein